MTQHGEVVTADEWTELVASGHKEALFTIEVGSGNDVYLSHKENPAVPVQGITGVANDTIIIEDLGRDQPIYARAHDGGGNVRVRAVSGISFRKNPRKYVAASIDTGDVGLLNSSGTEIDPATEPTLSSIAGALGSNATDDLLVSASATGGLAVEQQSPVGVEDSTGTQVDPRQQEAYDCSYTSIDLNTAATTTIYNPANGATVGAVHLANAGSTAEVRLEVTDGTNTAILADPGAGASLHFTDDLYLGADDSLQVVVEVTEGAALTGTAVASRGEL